MAFNRYQSLKKFKTRETEGIEIGTAYVFPKLDGAAAQIWQNEDKTLGFGSRNRVVNADNELKGFYNDFHKNEKLLAFFEAHPDLHLYGEFLIPHTFQDYVDEAWRRFFVYDVMRGDQYLTYSEYQPLMEEFGLDYIELLAVVINGEDDTFYHLLTNVNTYLVKDGAGVGEGIVIKNYDFMNHLGQKVWAKLVSNEFKANHRKSMGVNEYVNRPIEAQVVEKFITKALVEKEKAKIVLVEGEWRPQLMLRLLEVVFYCLITEEFYQAIKELEIKEIDMGRLQKFAYAQTKKLLFSEE